jgi:hypothetical protein
MYCSSTTLVKYEKDQRTATALRCRSWLCPECAPDRKRRLIKEILDGAPTVFLTLTIRHVPGETAPDAARRLIDAWRRARRSWMQLHKVKHLPFYCVVEATKLGWPHLHVMLRNVWISQQWLSDFMSEAINSPIVDIKKIDGAGRAAGYVGKYAGKCSQKFGTCKRYWRSRDYLLVKADQAEPEKKRRTGFEVEHTDIKGVASIWRALGWRVDWVSKWRCRAVITDS